MQLVGRAGRSIALVTAPGDPGANTGPQDAHDEYEVHRDKREFEALLLEQAARLGCQQPGRKARLTCLARHCSTREALAQAGERRALSGSTLWRNLKVADPPDWPTLHKLAAGTGLALVHWQLALHQLSAEQLAEALGQQTPQHALSRMDHRLLRGFWRMTPALQERLVSLAEAIVAQEPEPPPPTPEQQGEA